MQHLVKRVALAIVFLLAGAAQAQYPQRPIQLIVPWGAGGGTDATARIIAALMEKDLKQPINVVNRTGGSGVVGHDAIAKAAPDGYTIGLITVEITMMHHVGLTALKYSDYTPIGLVNADPAGIHVRVDSPYKTTKDLLAAIKAKLSGKMKASGTGRAASGIWRSRACSRIRASTRARCRGCPPTARPGLQDMVAGGVDVVPCSIPEARAMIDAGKVRALSIMDPNPPRSIRTCQRCQKELGSKWAIAAGA